MTFALRRQRLLDSLGENPDSNSVVLLVEPADVRWLTGLNSSNAVVAVGPDQVVLATDSRYAGEAKSRVEDLDGEVELVVSKKAKSAVLEKFAQLSPNAPEPEESPEAVSRARAIKDPDELAAIESACKISVDALAQLTPKIHPGQTEVEVARMLELEMAKLRAEDRAFPTIVAAGENSAVPHHSPTTRELKVGDLLKIDFGARVDGYNADCTRTFVVAAEPEEWQLEIHGQVLAASEAAKAAVRVGMEGQELDSVARGYLDELGRAEDFLHGLGHGVGLDIHEYPFVIPNSHDVLQDRSPFTIEPGLYLEGKGGVRIEDTCALIDDELVIFTEADRSLQRLG